MNKKTTNQIINILNILFSAAKSTEQSTICKLILSYLIFHLVISNEIFQMNN